MSVSIAYHGRVMPGIAVFKQVESHIEPADEHGDEHALLDFGQIVGSTDPPFVFLQPARWSLPSRACWKRISSPRQTMSTVSMTASSSSGLRRSCAPNDHVRLWYVSTVFYVALLAPGHSSGGVGNQNTDAVWENTNAI